ncbi:be19e307-ec9a-45de-8489-8105af960877 [Sclerotinia trifoliorum]|uniref:COP9 signalosome complex subunit 6 n=1 Tax=Sclerotinia trifoliorum TaxID=28548 RepID=A0A8H2W3Y5_9HELO|nr:be19e307-ec9a-45de-8489-8105af960877 [Sclerotinia trifoliorum]
MAMDNHNPLLSIQKSSDSGLQIALHPLVLLTISDYITRHTLRQQTGPVVGALLGQQNGREITIEHAFECLLEATAENEVKLSPSWFEARLLQMKDVHKVPPLDLVGWYTIIPSSGPQPIHLPIHRQILSTYNESAILLGFHPEEVLGGAAGGKLPLTIYESNYEAEESSGETGEDKEMKDEESQLKLRFKELPFTVETGEAEMISVDFVARGGGNATAVDGTSKKVAPAEGKGKGKATSEDTIRSEIPKRDEGSLSREDEEQLASLTAKANAIKMLQSRINLVAAYLQNLPPSYVSDGVASESDIESGKYAPVNHSILRSIQALLGRLSVLIPANSQGFEHELISEKNDVSLISLLSELTKSAHDIRETGKKFAIVENGKMNRMMKQDRGMSWGDQSHPMRDVMNVGDLLM